METKIKNPDKLLSKIQFTNFLQLRDVRGYKRFPTNWSPGSGKEIPNTA